jgi:hypothetical protein
VDVFAGGNCRYVASKPIYNYCLGTAKLLSLSCSYVTSSATGNAGYYQRGRGIGDRHEEVDYGRLFNPSQFLE